MESIEFRMNPPSVSWRRELGKQVSLRIADPRDEQRRPVFAECGDGAVGAGHFEQGHRARAQRERRHGLQLAFAHAHPLRELHDLARTDFLDHMRRDGVARVDQAVFDG